MAATILDRKEIEKRLQSKQYLIRGVRTESLFLGEGGGIWATNSIQLALTFGDSLELIPMPKNILESDMFSLAAIVGAEDFSELTTEEWSQIRKVLLDQGYDAVNLGQGHMDGATDYWILIDDVQRIPVECTNTEDNSK